MTEDRYPLAVEQSIGGATAATSIHGDHSSWDTVERQAQLRRLTDKVGQVGWRLTPATMAAHLTEGAWVPAKHLLYISARIASAVAKGNARIIMSMPPRHGKSEHLSVWTPIWYLDWFPQNEIMLASYGADLATDFGRKVRDTAQYYSEFLNFDLRRDAQNVAKWLTTQGGGMVSAGVGGPMTGRGADLLLIDDFLKSAKDATSETIRQDIYEWFQSVARTRVHPGGSIIIIATRWNKDDLIGRLLANQPDLWDHIKLPAFADEDDPLGRAKGEALWPGRYDKATLEGIQDAVGEYYWRALYQQDPISRAQALLDRDKLKIIEQLPKRGSFRKVRSWDFASDPEVEGGDYTVGTLMFEDESMGITYIVDVIRVRISDAEKEELIYKTAVNDGSDVEILLEQEPGSAGKTVVDYYTRKILKGFAVYSQRPTGPKPVRAQPFFASVQQGHVRLLEGSWNEAYIDELANFPDGTHDDQVDTSAAAFYHIHGDAYWGLVWGTPEKNKDQNKTELVSGVVWGSKVAKVSNDHV